MNWLTRGEILHGDFEELQENFRVLGKHLTNAAGCYAETEKSLTKLDAKLSRVEQPQLNAGSTEDSVQAVR